MKSITIAGGGLSGCLLLAAIKHRWPNWPVTLYEQSAQLSHGHTWSFHHNDIPAQSWAWLAPLVSKSWPGYDVIFPEYHRSFDSAYYSIQSEDLAQKIVENFAKQIEIGKEAPASDFLFHATGWPAVRTTAQYGYQKFVGLDIITKVPHGLTQPILKDVRWPQTDGYRFFYVLPWSPTELLIEDTYYSNSADINLASVTEQIYLYAEKQGWKIERIQRQEVGSLPLDLYATSQSTDPLALGAAAGMAHPVTGYTLPLVVRQIQTLLKSPEPNLNEWTETLRRENHILKRPFSFYRFLNRMMFHAAEPENRFRILQRFYKLPEGLIQRFYGGSTTWADEFRILCGKPPVPIFKALRQLSDRP